MAAHDRFTIAELTRRTGVPPATIHHYLRLGLLAPPKRAAVNRFLYDDRHVTGLRLIRVLRERRGLSLKTIRRVLPDLVALEAGEAFRPEMWDRAIDLRMGPDRRRTPGGRLLDAAVESFGRSGYGDVNVDDICRVARIAKGSFYRHFRSKEELFFAAAEAAAAQVTQAVAESVGDGPVPIDRLASWAADLMEPRSALFLDLLGRASQRRPGYPAAARRVFGDLMLGLGRHTDPADPERAGGEVLDRVLSTLLRRALNPDAVPLPLPARRR